LSATVVGSDRQASDPAASVTLPELVSWFRAQQQLVLPIAPPTASPFLQHGHPKALPFEPADLPLEMRQKLPGLVAQDCPVYPIFLIEDPDTRATVILNMHGEPVHSIPPPQDYNPYAYAQAKFPGLGTDAESSALLALYDPARIQVAVDLVPADFYAEYLAALVRLADDRYGGGIITSSPYSSTNLWLEINGTTNGCTGWTADLTIHTPTGDTNSSYDVYYSTCELVTNFVGSALATNLNWQFLMRCPTNIIAQTNVYARYLREDRELFILMDETNNCDLIVETNITPQEMAELLMPPWVTVANATNTGAVVARGFFTNGYCCGLPIDSGVILSSGYITNAIGPNNHDGLGVGILDGDPDPHLNLLVGGHVTRDAAVLEFDVISTNSCTLLFRYVYASEEYPEYTGSLYTDPMGIFVTTNRTNGQWQIGATNNIAFIPGDDNVPVRINTVHGGLVGSHSPTNALYYVDNHDPYYPSAPPYSMGEPVFDVQYDGMTVLLEAEACITANVTNHVKIAIADYTDWLYDSAVFLEVWSASQCQ
jgi:hypothetical protein